MPDRSRRTILREQTSVAHASLDGTISAFDSIASYGRYLRGTYAFRSAVESRLASAVWPASLCGWENQNFGSAIRQDLADLDMEPQDRIELPDISSGREEMLGLLYVLEGSALGSRILYKRAQALGLGADFGARHLAAQSERSDRWPRFLALLESADDLEMNRVTAASSAIFLAADTAFKRAYRHAQ